MPVTPHVKALSSRTAGQLRARVQPHRRTQSFTHALTDVLGTTRPPRKVYVLADATVGRPVRDWVARFPSGTVHVLSGQERPDWDLAGFGARWHRADTIALRDWQVRMLGAADVVIDVVPHDAAAQVENWRRLFLHLRPRGSYLADTSALPAGAFDPAWADLLAMIVGGATEREPRPPVLERESNACAVGIAVSRDAVVIRKRRRHLVKIPHTTVDRMLIGREPDVRLTTLATLPRGTLRSRAVTTSHGAAVEITGLDTSLPYPDLRLRHYEGPISLGGHSLVHTGDTILPDSFPNHLAQLTNDRIMSVSHGFARIARAGQPSKHLAGTFYHFDSTVPGDDARVTTELASRLWGWDAAKKAIPELRAYFQVEQDGDGENSLERQLLLAYGIAPTDIAWTSAPTTVDSLVAATPLWHGRSPHYVHPQIADVWARLAASLIDPRAAIQARIFVSSADGPADRGCRNAPAVEDFFRDHGFAIVRPETMNLRAKASTFGSARVIAGFGGSAMAGLLFAQRLETLVVLNDEGHAGHDEHLFMSISGADEHYFWSTPDEPDRGAWAPAAAWEFDFGRNAAELSALLERT